MALVAGAILGLDCQNANAASSCQVRVEGKGDERLAEELLQTLARRGITVSTDVPDVVVSLTIEVASTSRDEFWSSTLDARVIARLARERDSAPRELYKLTRTVRNRERRKDAEADVRGAWDRSSFLADATTATISFLQERTFAVHVDSAPSGASIEDVGASTAAGGKVTPFDIRCLAQGTRLTLELSHPGYSTKRTTLTAAANPAREVVILEPIVDDSRESKPDPGIQPQKDETKNSIVGSILDELVSVIIGGVVVVVGAALGVATRTHRPTFAVHVVDKVARGNGWKRVELAIVNTSANRTAEDVVVNVGQDEGALGGLGAGQQKPFRVSEQSLNPDETGSGPGTLHVTIRGRYSIPSFPFLWSFAFKKTVELRSEK